MEIGRNAVKKTLLDFFSLEVRGRKKRLLNAKIKQFKTTTLLKSRKKGKTKIRIIERKKIKNSKIVKF